MRILVYSDVHWCRDSSIVRGRGFKYSKRLENLIDSVNWAEQQAVENNCDQIVINGDFFDKAELDAESITALNEIKWAPIPHSFVVGNHEINRADLEFSSVHLFGLVPNATIYDSPVVKRYEDCELVFFPYSLEHEVTQEMKIYFRSTYYRQGFPTIMFCHNDIKGINYGRVLSQQGFTVEQLESMCDLCINGHIHNNGKVSDKIINIGNLTGQNFSEDAFEYEHDALIIDTDHWENGKVEILENPYAFNFYKLDFTVPEHKGIDYLNKLTLQLKRNAVLTVKCYKDDSYECYRARFDPDWPENGFPKCSGVVTSKFIIEREQTIADTNDIKESFSVDHINQFKEFVLNTIGTDDIVKEELQEVCK